MVESEKIGEVKQRVTQLHKKTGENIEKSKNDMFEEEDPGEKVNQCKLLPWLQQSQVIVPGNVLVGQEFASTTPPPTAAAPTAAPPPPQQQLPPPLAQESSTLLTTAPLVINGLLVATVAMIMIVRPQMQETQHNLQKARETEETNIQAGDFSESLRVLIVFLIASAIYISPYLRKYVPPIVRLIGGMMIGIVFNLALKYMS